MKKIFIYILTICGAISILSAQPKTTQHESAGFFTVDKVDGKWRFITPEGDAFFSLGINHIDPASMRYPENIDIWEDKYDGSTIKWIKESVAPNLRKWGFNTMGWEQEVTVMQWQHSRSFTVDELRALDMPYCRMLPFNEAHQWEKHTVHYDFFSEDWIEWCDYVARSYCSELKDDPNLIGYFFSDCPTWIHTTPQNEWRGPAFNPEELESQEGRDKLSAMATQYYKTIYEAIRRYDPHHLILGDRYEVNAPIAMEVIEAAAPYVDVLSFQDFNNPAKHMQEWYERTGKPVLLADGAKIIDGDGIYKRTEGEWYAEQIDILSSSEGCVGFHLCGAYQRNKARRRGLLDEYEQEDEQNTALIKAANNRVNNTQTIKP